MIPSTFVRIVSLLQQDGTLSVYQQEQPVPVPGGDQLLIRIDGAPINPADVKSLFCSAGPDTLHAPGGPGPVAVNGRVAPTHLSAYRNRIGVPLPVGNEGTGVVVSAGMSRTARSLLGRRVSIAAGGMFGEYQLAHPGDCIAFPGELGPEQTAAAWINPMTALAMIDTMEREGHGAIVLTAAASSLGQMVNRLCIRSGIPIVNIVRSDSQVAALRELGATHVCNSGSPHFEEALTEALLQTGATLAFDATGGGTLAGTILHAMERGLSRTAAPGAGYGSTTYKQLYFFGGLDPSPVHFRRRFGMAWGMGGWLLQTALAKADPDALENMKLQVQNGIDTTFATRFNGHLTLDELLDPRHIQAYSYLKTGEKYLLRLA